MRSKINRFIFTAALISQSFAAVPLWGQCGGQGWTGETTCVSGATCSVVNQWYHQCLPGSNVPTSTATQSFPTTTGPGNPGPTTTSIPTGSLQQLSNFGPNPNSVRVFIYVPSGLVAKPAVVVAIHYCGGTANAMYTGTPWKQYADSGKHIILYPEAPHSTKCWDVHSKETLTHDAGGDSLGIVSAVRWTLSNFSGDSKRVFATGISSGAFMTNVLMGAYPDVFAAGSAWSGVPYACFEGPNFDRPECARGQVIQTGVQWGNSVRNGYPAFNGTRPKFQTWHGTDDNVVVFQCFREQIKQWTNVFGVSETPSSTTQNYGSNGWTRTDYGPNFMAISASGGGHMITYQGVLVKQWFGIA